METAAWKTILQTMNPDRLMPVLFRSGLSKEQAPAAELNYC